MIRVAALTSRPSVGHLPLPSDTYPSQKSPSRKSAAVPDPNPEPQPRPYPLTYQVCWTSPTEQNLRGPHVARQRLISAAGRAQQQTRRPSLLLWIDEKDGRTVTRPFQDAYRCTYYADRVNTSS